MFSAVITEAKDCWECVKKGNNWGGSNAKASLGLEQLLFCPPTDVLLNEDTMVGNELSLMLSFGIFCVGALRLHPQYLHSSGHRGKITQTLIALREYICLSSLEARENFQASKLAMQRSSNLSKEGALLCSVLHVNISNPGRQFLFSLISSSSFPHLVCFFAHL